MTSPGKASRGEMLADALIPFCIFGAVGSLMYFLVDLRSVFVFGGGAWLKYVFFWYLVGIVGIHRIRKGPQGGSGGVYAFLLAVAMSLFVFRFTNVAGAAFISPGVGGWLALVLNGAIVWGTWWGTNRFASACSAREWEASAKGEGLLARSAETPSASDRARRRRRSHPGVSVLHLSAAAILLFGVSARVLAGAEEGIRRSAFWSAVAYAFFALLLLVLTSFSGLREYARKKYLLVPAVTEVAWLLGGGMLIVLIVGLSVVLPKSQGISRQTIARIMPGAPAARGPSVPVPVVGATEAGRRAGGAIGEPPVSTLEPGGAEGEGAPGEEGRGKGDSSSQTGEEAGETTEGPGGAQGAEEVEAPGRGETSSAPGRGRGFMPRPPEIPPGPFLKFVMVILCLVGAYYLWKERGRVLGLIRSFSDFPRTFRRSWKRLMELLSGLVHGLGAEKRVKAQAPPGPPSPKVYRNPFRSGALVARMAPNEVARYTYAALQAYAAFRGVARPKGATPYEYAELLASSLGELHKEASALTDIYVLAEYSGEEIPSENLDDLRLIWDRLEMRINAV